MYAGVLGHITFSMTWNLNVTYFYCDAELNAFQIINIVENKNTTSTKVMETHRIYF